MLEISVRSVTCSLLRATKLAYSAILTSVSPHFHHLVIHFQLVESE